MKNVRFNGSIWRTDIFDVTLYSDRKIADAPMSVIPFDILGIANLPSVKTIYPPKAIAITPNMSVVVTVSLSNVIASMNDNMVTIASL